jgi:hypothetical protein
MAQRSKLILFQNSYFSRLMLHLILCFSVILSTPQLLLTSLMSQLLLLPKVLLPLLSKKNKKFGSHLLLEYQPPVVQLQLMVTLSQQLSPPPGLSAFPLLMLSGLNGPNKTSMLDLLMDWLLMTFLSLQLFQIVSYSEIFD